MKREDLFTTVVASGTRELSVPDVTLGE